MALTTAEKKELSKTLYAGGYTKTQTAELLNISDALIDDYWDEWDAAWIKVVSDPMIVTHRGAVLSAEHGAGAIGTAFAPRTYRRIENGHIITEILIDITGLGCKGDAQGDAIGLAAGGAAYIGRNVVATNGIIYRIEMICLEAPAEGTATYEPDIDLMAEDDGDVEYDGPVDDTIIAAARDWVAGEMAVNNVPKLTANDYLYLGEGDTGGATGVYSAGQFLIRLFGHPALVA
jgi:hypothetical protein